jgi:hypothetical protein
MTILKLTAIVTPTGAIIPKALLDRMIVGKGDALYAVEAPDGSYRLIPTVLDIDRRPIAGSD